MSSKKSQEDTNDQIKKSVIIPEQAQDASEAVQDEPTDDAPVEQDSQTTLASNTVSVKSRVLGRLKRLKSSVFSHKKLLVAALVVVLAGVTAYSVPATRYAVLNVVGSADANILVVSATTNQPVKGATVQLAGGQSSTTDDNGIAFFNDIPYGKITAQISKNAYETRSIDVEISKDNITLGGFEIVPTGFPVRVSSTDWLSKKPISDFTVSSRSDESLFVSEGGTALLNVPTEMTEVQEYIVSSEGYNDTVLRVDPAKIERSAETIEESTIFPVALTTVGKHYFISNRDGDIGFYASNFDGTDANKLVSTNQKEYLEYYTIPDSENSYVVLLESDASKNDRQDQLGIVRPLDGRIDIIDEVKGQDLDFSVVAISEKQIIYSVTYEADRADKFKLKSYDLITKKLSTHYTSPAYQWNVVYDKERAVLYVNEQKKSFPYESGFSRTLIRIDLQNNKKTVLVTSTDLYNAQIHQSKPHLLHYFVSSVWYNKIKSGYYSMDLADNSIVKYLGASYPDFEDSDEIPDSEKGKASPAGGNRAWLDFRDGKSRLILNESTNVIRGEIDSLSINNIIRWIDETRLTVTGNDGSETADYIVDTETGNYRKITNTFISSYGHGNF